ncbi:hypothetical protein WJX81_005786 [Elliptochloris bilobata]|uniref:DHHA1 domain-containing protein n=1 Tax=Elliptochloris bilobata TaxID=381761 RepID=A0AAW1R1W6_9CHLO
MMEVTQTLRSLMAYVQDADFWHWRLPHSRACSAGLAPLKLEYDAAKNPGVFDALADLVPEDLIEQGRAALEQEGRLIAAALDAAFRVDLGGAAGRAVGWGSCLVVHAEGDVVASGTRSALGNALAERSAAAGLRPIGVVAYHEAGWHGCESVKLSLRSLGGEDTTTVTQAHGGGGHRNASSHLVSCLVAVSEFEGWRSR